MDISDALKLMVFKSMFTNTIDANANIDAITNYSVGLLRQTNDQFQIAVSDQKKHKEHIISLSPENVLDLIGEGMKKGKLMKDATTGLPYYARDFEP